MNERVQMLRQASLEIRPWISSERAQIVTDVYREAGSVSAPLLRAMVFSALMERKAISIGDGELIVGERGPAPKGTPTFPELCCHTLSDLEILDSREKISYIVSDEVRSAYAESVIPFWQGKTMRERIFCEMTPEWVAAYKAGIFTEFMEQRAPGHTVADGKIYRKGFLQFKAEIEDQLQALDYTHDPRAYERSQELRAMAMDCQAIISYARRYAELAARLAEEESDPTRKKELVKIAEVCSWAPAQAPRDFWEALQMYWFVHLGVVTELNTWDSFCPGHLDRHLQPFYQAGLSQETLTREQAKELLQCFWVKFNNQPAPPKVGVTAAESGTYTDFANINIGGLLADGKDGVSDTSHLILEVIDEMRLLQPSSNIQLAAVNSDQFLNSACRIIRKGWGQPSLFNADLVVEEMLRAGKTIEDAREGGISGCVETGAFGKEAYILTGYFNLVKALEITLQDGWDPRTQTQIGIHSGDPRRFQTFESFYQAFLEQLRHFVEIKVRGNAVIERLYATLMPAPFLSIIVDDCIAKGCDYNDGGPRYNSAYIMGAGTGSLTDSLSAIRKHVFQEKTLSMDSLLETLKEDFQGCERTRQLLWNKTPRYGNDDDDADELMLRAFHDFNAMVEGRPNTKGGQYRVNYLSTTCHVYFGSVTGATPDGRRAWTPLSDGISPVQGADRQGPTAVLRSAAKMDHAKTGGTLLNQKFTPSLLAGESGLANLGHLVRGYFKMGGHHIQFNVVTSETLRAAQAEPEKYRDLIVRVAGYSDYFCDLTPSLQEEIIARTEQTRF